MNRPVTDPGLGSEARYRRICFAPTYRNGRVLTRCLFGLRWNAAEGFSFTMKGLSAMPKTMRFGVAGITQESNTFASSLSTVADFSIEEGDGVISSSKGTNTEVGGFLKGLDALRVEAVPLLSAWAVSAGPIEDSAFDTLADRLIAQIKKNKFDGLLLALHGAWLSASHPSADAEMVKRVRRAIGPEIPIVITQDSHANVTPSLLKEIQGLVGYRTYPHVDMGETGEKAARLLYEVVTNRLHPCIYYLPIPLLAPPQSATTDRPPIQDILRRLDRELPSDQVLSSSLFYVQPWLDIKDVNSSLVVVTRSESAEVPVILRTIADELWSRRGGISCGVDDSRGLASQGAQREVAAGDRL